MIQPITDTEERGKISPWASIRIRPLSRKAIFPEISAAVDPETKRKHWSRTYSQIIIDQFVENAKENAIS